VLIGFAGGRIQEIKAAPVLVKNFSVLGLHWGTYVDRRPDLVTTAHDALCQLVADGALRPLVAGTVPFEQAPAALLRLAGGQVVGRLAVAVR
jgi:NADPH:quinone reductase